MSFLPQDDRDYLADKGFAYVEREEPIVGGKTRRAIEFPNFEFQGTLVERPTPDRPDVLAPRSHCRLLILIPDGYATTKLDSFYTSPRLYRQDGNEPVLTSGREIFFGQEWQFWSRHLAEGDWRPGIDGLHTYLQYVAAELKKA